MRIIDARFRPGTRDTLQGILTNPLYQTFSAATNFAARPEQTLEQEIAMLRQLGVVKAVVTGRDIASTVNTASTNPGMLECLAVCPELFIGFYGIDPHLRMQGLRSFRAAIRDHGVAGGSIDPGMSRLPVNDALYYPFYAACCDAGIPMAITTGCSGGMPNVVLEHMAPWLIDRVAADFPELRIIISHGGYPWITETLAVTLRHANVYLDFSASTRLPQAEQYVQAANGPLMHKILFSSAHPFEHIADTLKFYAALPFIDEARECVMHANAAALFGVR